MSERYPPLNLSPQRQRQKTLEVVLTVVLAIAPRQPVLLIVEDLHWIDPTTLELLSCLIDRTPTARILTLLTCRPEFRPPWTPRGHLTFVTLSRLARIQAEVLVACVAGGKTLPGEVVQQVVAKTNGVPLFVEELNKMVLESGWLRERDSSYELTSPRLPLAIPATLHDSLMARLDRLGPVKEVAQLEATLGRAFPYALLQAVSLLDEGTLQRALSQLVEAELLYQRGVPPQATYLFKHALIQEVAYQSVLKRTRQRSHRRIAQVLEERFSETAETQPELLAYHYTEAGLTAQAISYWQRAGARAIQRSAHVEATRHLTKGLELLLTLPDTPERAQRELALQLSLGSAFMVLKGWAAADVQRVYARARALCAQVGQAPQLLRVLNGLQAFHLVRADLQTARELGEQYLHVAQSVHHPQALLRASHQLGETLFYCGEFAAARAHFVQGMALSTAQPRTRHPLSVTDPGLACVAWAAHALWVVGYPDQALTHTEEALSRAQELSYPFDLAYALSMAAELHQFRQEGPLTQARAEALMALSTEQGFAAWRAQGLYLWGWALTQRGEVEEGMGQMREGLAAWQATGAAIGRTAVMARAPGGGLSNGGASRGRPARRGRGVAGSPSHAGTVVYCRTVSTQRRAAAGAAVGVSCRGRNLSSSRPRRRPPPGGEVAGAAGGDEPEPAVAVPGQAHRSPRPARADLRLVHRGLDTADLQDAKALLERLGG
jgi:tetratricopeptide (TPR) repeat protein